MDAASFTAQIEDAVQYASKHGWTISYSRFVPEAKELCIISAIYLNSMQYDLSTHSSQHDDKIIESLIHNEQKTPSRLQTLRTYIAVLVACEKALHSQDFAFPDSEDWRDCKAIAHELKYAGLLHLIAPDNAIRLWTR